MKFPAYRKYRDLNTWFCIVSDTEFIEVRKMGERWLKTTVKATIYPEKLRIRDMLELHENRWEIISEDSYKEAEARVVD